jgi:hypothetical protein
VFDGDECTKKEFQNCQESSKVVSTCENLSSKDNLRFLVGEDYEPVPWNAERLDAIL